MVQQTIKDVNQSLIDDGLVLGDKIGSANFFWSFPSKYFQDLLTLKERTLKSISEGEEKIAAMKVQLIESRAERKMDGREALLEELAALQDEERKLDSELNVMKYNDPAEIEKNRAMARRIKEAADRWTDNIWTIKSFLTKKKGMAAKEVRKYLHQSYDFYSILL